ncbi:MAG: DUF3089 domain-containing protein, partial [Ginsengibacter sp.]
MSNYKQYFLAKGIIFILSAFSWGWMASCSHKISGQQINYHFQSKDHRPDYSNLNYWAASPFKYDPSDNVPKDFKNKTKDSLADVFFIYPTTYTDSQMPEGWNADIDDEAINKKTDNSTILYQASIFNKYCRVFAPRYRQANIEAFGADHKQEANAAFDTAYEDVRNAFEYYLEHYNHG